MGAQGEGKDIEKTIKEWGWVTINSVYISGEIFSHVRTAILTYKTTDDNAALGVRRQFVHVDVPVGSVIHGRRGERAV